MLDMTGIKYTAIPSDADESFTPGTPPDEVVCMLALRKAESVAESYGKDAVVIGSDTIVYCNGEILGKPKDREDAARMLRMLSGREHMVYSGLALVGFNKKVSEACGTSVLFRMLSDSDIENYIESTEPMDKAGAYAIQEKGGLFVERIDGDFNTVVGMPLCRLGILLNSEFGYDILSEGNKLVNAHTPGEKA